MSFLRLSVLVPNRLKTRTIFNMFDNKLADKLWRMNNLYYIQTKNQRLLPVELNPAQADYISRRKTRNYILKARQLGFSTLGLIDLLDETIFHKNTVSAVIAHEKQKVIQLFEIIKRAYEHLPNDPRLKPRVSIENRNELYFPDLGSKIFVTMDTRGQTVHNLHVSELAFIARAESRLAATLESVPLTGRITFETTANGMSNFAYQEWNNADSEYDHYFYNWLWDDTYRLTPTKSREEMLIEYRQLALHYGLLEDAPERYELDDEQLTFYLSKVYRHRKLVLQEYPFNDTEAFISSGLGVFSTTDLAKHPVGNIQERLWNDCLVWEKPQEGFRYVLGVDSSEGTGNDNACIEVLNASTGNQAAEFASPNIPPDELASYVLELAKRYNRALIVPEINSSGISLVDHIKTKYGFIYKRQVFDKRSREQKEMLGWRTTSVTKPKLVHDLEEAVRMDDIAINSREAVAEMQTFVRTEEQGQQGYGAEGINKDDRVIALGLAVQGMKQLPARKAPKPIAAQKMDEYIERKRLSQQFDEPAIRSILAKRKQRYAIRR